MKLTAIICALVASTSLLTAVPAFAKDAAADLQKDEAKAASDRNKVNKQVAKGHTFRAGRAAKKAEKAEEKVDKDLQK
jgi:hypothetical protein